LVAMPKTPVSHIHNTAPGPPEAIAVATPTILPVPTVAAKAVVKAPKWLISPSPSLVRSNDNLIALPIYRWINFNRKVRKICVPMRKNSITGPQARLLRSERNFSRLGIKVPFLGNSFGKKAASRNLSHQKYGGMILIETHCSACYKFLPVSISFYEFLFILPVLRSALTILAQASAEDRPSVR